MSDRRRVLGRPFRYTDKKITFILIGISAVVFLFTRFDPNYGTRIPPLTFQYLGLHPVSLTQMGFVWTPVTYLFVHGSTFHLLFNMVALYFFGRPLEQRLGSWEFLTYYLITGIFTGLFTLGFYFFTGVPPTFLIGASGAIFALLLGFAALFPGARVMVWFVPMPAPVAVLVFGIIALVSQMTGRIRGISHLAHLSGLLFGYLYFRIRLGGDPIRAMIDYWRRR